MTDEKKNEATAEEKRAHMAGLVKETARLTATIAHAVAYLVQQVPTEDIDRLNLHHRADNLRRMVDDLDAGVYRGRINDNVRTAPGALVARGEAMAELGAALAELPDDVAREALNTRRGASSSAFVQEGARPPFVTPTVPKPRTPIGAPTPADYEAQGAPPPNWRSLKDDEPTE